MKKERKGFTLIELLVVISIIALLSSVVLVAVQSAREKAQLSKVKSEMSEFVKALEIYRTSYGKYPPSSACTNGLCTININQNAVGYDSFSNTLGIELKNAKAYNGNLAKTLNSIPKTPIVNFTYTTDRQAITDHLTDGDPNYYWFNCDGKTDFKEYYMYVYVQNTNGDYTSGLDTTYWRKEYQHASQGDTPSWSGYYCTGN